jgi:hypothetical protein
MIQFHNYIAKALDDREHAIAIFCDLKKAFDTVDHNILISKMDKIGIRGLELDWFKNYLTGRQQFVSLNNVCSTLRQISIGVPQGSVLGPVLFLLYINDLPDATSFTSLLFADDTTLLARNKDMNELIEYVNDQLHKISTYFRTNRLSLHPLKTKYIIFTNSAMARNANYNLYIDNNDVRGLDVSKMHEITRALNEPVRFLGLLIDADLKYTSHVNKIKNKISTGLFFLRKAKNFLTLKGLKSLYYSLIHSHIIYAIHIWATCCNLGIFNNIFNQQKKAIRIIHNAAYNAHTENLFKSSKILPLPKLTTFFQLQFMQQFSNGFLPNSFVNLWITREARREFENSGAPRYLLRNSDDLYLPPARLKTTEKAPFYIFPRLWDSFPNQDIKITRNKSDFNTKLKKYYLDELESDYRCSRLLCPHCHLNISIESVLSTSNDSIDN